MIKNELRYFAELDSNNIPDIQAEALKIKKYDKDVLRKYSFDYMGLMPWIEEGIGQFVRNDGVDCGNRRPQKVTIKIRKEYIIEL